MAASQARYLMLTARKSDLQLQLKAVNEMRADVKKALASASGDRKKKLKDAEKKLDQELKRIKTQLAAVEKAIKEIKKVLGKNIEGSF